jgi:hypothetical protein
MDKIVILLLFLNSFLLGITFDFEKYPVGKLPESWAQGSTAGSTTKWQVIKDQGNNVLTQTYNENPTSHFNIVINDEIEVKNIDLSVRVRAVGGRKDQGGGLVWRYKDPQNYYVVRANPLENNVVLYKVEEGVRTDLPLLGRGLTYGVDVSTLGNGWHTLRVTVKELLFTVYLDNKELFKVRDATFEESGRVGLWTKSDAVSYFDDFSINPY